ncbi:MAG TPA: PAS domain S-box protein, partial [Phycisphaerae bacterium]
MKLESVITTAQLASRPSRPPNYEAENRALLALAHEMVAAPKNLLQKLVETALSLCRAQSAGISLLESSGQSFHWPAIAGTWASHVGGGTPRNFGPCGTVLDRNAPQLMSRVERYFTYFQPIQPLVEEALLIPFYIEGKAVGTIWVVAHEKECRFDAEDLRIMSSLATFASAAYKVVQHQEALRQEELHFREIIDTLPVAVYTTDANGMLTHFNPAAVEFSGRTPRLGTDQWCVSFKLFRPDGTPLPHDECPMAISLKEGRAVRGEEAIAERPDGTRVDFVAYPTPLFDAEGRVTGGVNMLLDVSDRKHDERARASLAAIVESSDDAIISKDLSSIITNWNRGAERLFGYTAKEAIGQSITMLMPLERLNEEPGILDRIRRRERIDHYETIRRAKDGTLLDISLSVSPISDAQGRIVGASKIARDITDRKRAEAA